jgi:organic hydroperoxide reductase OsmC/OhrA
MTTTTSSTPIRNGIDTGQVYGTLDLLKAQPELARFEFRVQNRWIDGTHSRSTIHGFWGAGAEDVSRTEPFVVDASEPPVLFGQNEAPNPAEFLLHALAGCLTLTIVNVAAARKVELYEVSAARPGSTTPTATASTASTSPSPSAATRAPRSCARSSTARCPGPSSTT